MSWCVSGQWLGVERWQPRKTFHALEKQKPAQKDDGCSAKQQNNQKDAGGKTSVEVLLAALKACSRTGNLRRGKSIHAETVKCRQDCNVYVATALINMYAMCGSMVDAREVFVSIKHPDVVAWTALILGYANNGQSHTALDLFWRMKTEGPVPNSVTIVAVLKACTSLAVTEGQAECRVRGEKVRNVSVENGLSSDVYVQCTLIYMYAKCGGMTDALEVFDSINHPTVVSWNVLILGYADNGEGHTALNLFRRMRSEGPAPVSLTLVAALKACTTLAVQDASRGGEYRDWGKQIHTLAFENGFDLDAGLQSTLAEMYAKCGSMVDAREVFDHIKCPDVVSWTSLIFGYAGNGQGRTALDLFRRMESEGPPPDSVTIVAALKACTNIAMSEGAGGCKDVGKALHNSSLENGCLNVHVQCSLIDMYSKCGSILDAREVFDSVKHLTVVSWNVLILGYADNGQGDAALNLFSRMRAEGLAPDSVTFIAALKACTSLAMEGVSRWAECRDKGNEIHNFTLENGCHSDPYVQNTLVDMYVKCGSMVDARNVFDSVKHRTVICWNVLILGYADNEQGRTGLDVFTKMRIEGPAPNSLTFIAALKACTSFAVKEGHSQWAECRDRAKEIYSIALENDCMSDVFVSSTLADMYVKCGSLVDAQEVFDGTTNPDVVLWNLLILGYLDNGQAHTALDKFVQMASEGPAPNSVTFGIVLKACGLVGALEFGRAIHLDIGNDIDVVLVTCLVDFYAKCGSLVEAQNVFDLHAEKRDMITWNALLGGFSSCGDNDAVFRVFEGMQESGFKPDGVTILCILTCCSHVGHTEKGKQCFDAMSSIYEIIPTIDHYNCMLDIFGRANKLDDARTLLDHMPCSPNSVTWMTILGACRKWNNVEIGRLAFQSLVELNVRDI